MIEKDILHLYLDKGLSRKETYSNDQNKRTAKKFFFSLPHIELAAIEWCHE